MAKLNYIDFENPPMTYSIIPHAHCMIYKPQREIADVSGIDYIHRPRTNWEHYARVLEAKMKQKYKTNIKPLVRSVAYP
jgi:hypothetical protein